MNDPRQFFRYVDGCHVWDTFLTDQDREWLADHIQLIWSMTHWTMPRDPYESARR